MAKREWYENLSEALNKPNDPDRHKAEKILLAGPSHHHKEANSVQFKDEKGKAPKSLEESANNLTNHFEKHPMSKAMCEL